MARDPNDDGAPYGASGPVEPDATGSTRIHAPGRMRPGAQMKPVPLEATRQAGAMPTALPFDPMTHKGALPTRLGYDPLAFEGSEDRVPLGAMPTRIQSTVSLQPEHVVYVKLSREGSQPWMLGWVQSKGQRGEILGQQFMDKLATLAHYGDAGAAQIWHYARQVSQAVENHMAAKRQAAAARMGVILRGPGSR